MATHSSNFAWEIPWTEKPGGLQSMESRRVRNNLSTNPPPPNQLYQHILCRFEIMMIMILQQVTRDDNGTPLQYSCLENPMDRGAWWAAVHRVAKSRTRLSDFTFTFHFHALEKEMATHSGVLAWRIPGMVEPGGLPSMGSHRVGHD